MLWRRIEVVITGRTRNVVATLQRYFSEMPITSGLQLSARLLEFKYMESYRSGHNEPDSKSGSPKGLEGSNPSLSVQNCMILRHAVFVLK